MLTRSWRNTSKHRGRKWALIGAFCLLASLLVLLRQSESTFDGGKMLDRVAFVPRFPDKFFDCSDLFSARTQAHNFVTSDEYKSRSEEFMLAVNDLQ